MNPSSCSNGLCMEKTCPLCLWLRVDAQSLDQSQASSVDHKFALAPVSPCPFSGGICCLGRGGCTGVSTALTSAAEGDDAIALQPCYLGCIVYAQALLRFPFSLPQQSLVWTFPDFFPSDVGYEIWCLLQGSA